MADETDATDAGESAEPGAAPETEGPATEASAADAEASATEAREAAETEAQTEPPGSAVATTESDEAGTELVPAEQAALPAVWPPPPTPRQEQRKERVWLPLLVPLCAVIAVAVYSFNVSRVFLAASKDSTDIALAIGIGITVAILAGATVIAAAPKIRTTSLVLALIGVFAVVMLSGSIVLGAAEPEHHAAGGCPYATGKAVNVLNVTAGPGFNYGQSVYNVPAGITQINFQPQGTHTLSFDGQPFSACELETGQKITEQLDFTAGAKYTIFCSIPGHRAAGMQAEIDVGAAAAGAKPIPGTGTPTTTLVPPGGVKKPSNNGKLPQSGAGQATEGG
jgi:plastocyanin